MISEYMWDMLHIALDMLPVFNSNQTALRLHLDPVYITARGIDSVCQRHSGEIGLRALGIAHMVYASTYP